MPARDDPFSVQEFETLVQKGKAAYRAGRMAEAIQAWQGAQAADPTRGREVEEPLAKASARQIAVHIENARRMEHLGDLAQAGVEYRKALMLKPRDEALRQELGDALRSCTLRSRTLPAAALAAVGAGMLAVAAIVLWWIIFKLD